MKYQKLLCEKCKEKIREEWKKEKKVYRLRIKKVGKEKVEKIKIICKPNKSKNTTKRSLKFGQKIKM